MTRWTSTRARILKSTSKGPLESAIGSIGSARIAPHQERQVSAEPAAACLPRGSIPDGSQAQLKVVGAPYKKLVADLENDSACTRST